MEKSSLESSLFEKLTLITWKIRVISVNHKSRVHLGCVLWLCWWTNFQLPVSWNVLDIMGMVNIWATASNGFCRKEMQIFSSPNAKRQKPRTAWEYIIQLCQISPTNKEREFREEFYYKCQSAKLKRENSTNFVLVCLFCFFMKVFL